MNSGRLGVSESRIARCPDAMFSMRLLLLGINRSIDADGSGALRRARDMAAAAAIVETGGTGRS